MAAYWTTILSLCIHCLLVPPALTQEYSTLQASIPACGTKFTDLSSSALLADIVLQGSVERLHQASPLTPLLYKASVTVQKVYKGQELLRVSSAGAYVGFRPVEIERFGPEENRENCVAKVQAGQSYIFFLKIKDGNFSSTALFPQVLTAVQQRNQSGDSPLFMRNTALPAEMDLNALRLVRRVLCPGCTSQPVIRRLRCQNCAVRPSMQKQMSPERRKVIMAGKRLALRCAAKGTPRPTYSWFKDASLLYESPANDSLATRGGNGASSVFRSGTGLTILTTQQHSLLKIKNVQASDAGNYRCIASNAIGEAEQAVHLVVEVIQSADEDSYDPCAVNPCRNGGTCRVSDRDGRRTRCECTQDFDGGRCQFPVQLGSRPGHLEQAVSRDLTRGNNLFGDLQMNKESTEDEDEDEDDDYYDEDDDLDTTVSSQLESTLTTTTQTTTTTSLSLTRQIPIVVDNTGDALSRIQKQRLSHLPSSRGLNYGSDGADNTSNQQVKASKSGAQQLKVSDCPEEDYCLNNGRCKFVVKIQRRYCECVTGFAGRRCEISI